MGGQAPIGRPRSVFGTEELVHAADDPALGCDRDVYGALRQLSHHLKGTFRLLGCGWLSEEIQGKHEGGEDEKHRTHETLRGMPETRNLLLGVLVLFEPRHLDGLKKLLV